MHHAIKGLVSVPLTGLILHLNQGK
jgi:hypothetical protein